MNSLEIHRVLASFLLGTSPDETDGLVVMLLLHTQHIVFGRTLMDDRPTVTELCAITQRHAAESVADAWPDREDRQRTSRYYWFEVFNLSTPYEVVEDMPELWRDRLNSMKARLVSYPDVESLADED